MIKIKKELPLFAAANKVKLLLIIVKSKSRLAWGVLLVVFRPVTRHGHKIEKIRKFISSQDIFRISITYLCMISLCRR